MTTTHRHLIAILRGIDAGRVGRRLRGPCAGRHHADRGAAQLAPARSTPSAPLPRPCRAGPRSVPAPCSASPRSTRSSTRAAASSSRPTATRPSSPARACAGCASYPGVFSPTEAFRAIRAGAHGLKIFPAELVGPVGVKALKAVLPPGNSALCGGRRQSGQLRRLHPRRLHRLRHRQLPLQARRDRLLKSQAAPSPSSPPTTKATARPS